MMGAVGFKIVDEPPPPRRGELSDPRLAIEAACEANPGAWLEFDPLPKKDAECVVVSLKRRGFEAVSRAARPIGFSSIYARKP